MTALHQSQIKSLPLLARGKVRDMYAVGDDKLLIVASDRISAFDVILDDPIPGKGQVLTELTEFWLKKLAHVVPNHSTGIAPEDVVTAQERDQVAGRGFCHSVVSFGGPQRSIRRATIMSRVFR